MTIEISLPNVLDLRAATPLSSHLREHVGAPVALDAGQVERVGGLCLQVLIAAAAAWRDAGQQFHVVNASAAFRDDVRRMGATSLISGSDPSC